MADGLSNSIIYCIGKDKYGFIWIGTANGLNIYNGIRFKNIFAKPNDNNTIPGNNISSLLFEKDSVWIGTRSGLCRMDIQSKISRRIDLGENRDIRTIYREKNTNYLWIGTQTGLIKYNIKDDKYQIFNTTNSNISHDIIRAIYKDSDGNFWVGTFNKLNKLPANSAVFEVIDMKREYRPSIKNNLTMSILPYSDKSDSLLWIGTQTGLALFNRYTGETKFFREENYNLSNSAIKTLCKTQNKLWLGTDFGLLAMNEDFIFKNHFHDPFESKSLINSTVWCAFNDDSGTLWFGTNNGVSILSKSNSQFLFYPMSFKRDNNISGYEIRDIIEDKFENLWMATQFGVVNFHPEKGKLQTFNSEQPEEKKLSINGCKYLMEDQKDRIWISTNGGLVLWDNKKHKLNKFTADFNSNSGLRTNYLTDIFELSDGTILVNTLEGMHKVQEKNGKITFRYIGNFGPNVEYENDYLLSFRDLELIKINTKTFEQKSEIIFDLPNSGSQILSVHIADKNTVWIGLTHGLIHYDLQTKEYEYYEIKSNKNYALISLISDSLGNIWASSYSAILKFSPQSKDFEIYPSSEDIPINRFFEDCCTECKNGDLIFGGHDGFIRFNPDKIKKSEFVPPVVITGLQISGHKITPNSVLNGKRILEKDISFTNHLVLAYSNNSFSLEFSSLQFDKRDGIRYAFKLDNVDHNWNYINGPFGNAVFSDLRAGDYIFRLKGTNNDGVWNNKETVLFLTITPPLWASPLFLSIYIILILAIAGSIIYYYTNRLKMQNELKIVRMEKQHSENIAADRQKFFTSIAHEFKTPLSLIIGPVEKLIQDINLDKTGKKYLQLIEKNARRLLWLNNQLLDFRQLENKSLKMKIDTFDIVEFTRNIYTLFTDKAHRKNIEYLFYTEFNKFEVSMDSRKIETILFNLLSNAFKFTRGEGKIKVSVQHCTINPKENKEGGICISVKDTGIGIPSEDQNKVFDRFYQTKEAAQMERGSGIGLTLVYEYVKMHKGEIILTSEPGKGTEFKINLPFGVNYSIEDSTLVEKEKITPILKSTYEEEMDIEAHSQILTNKPNLLLIEDDKEISNFIWMSLKDKFSVQIASNGKDAFQKIASQIPDLVVSDIIMPEMDGLEFTKRFKNNPRTSHIPLILLTGDQQTERQLEALKSGADAYLVKPFEIELLELRIKNFLKRRTQFVKYLQLSEIVTPKNIQISSQDEKMLAQIVNCIENNISEPDLDITKLCKITGYSHSILYRKIKKLTGQTVTEFIRNVRLKRAEQLLRMNKLTISEVMDQTGFASHSYFSKCFRKQYKMSPKQYVNQT